MVDHVVVRKLEHLTGTSQAPALGFAVETRDRPGPAFKGGSAPDEEVWVQLHGGLFVARARIKLGWVGEYSRLEEVRRRTTGSPVHDHEDFWAGRPRVGYAAVASLTKEHWVDPFWGGPRTYAYEWVLLEEEKKRASWLDHKEPPRGGSELLAKFRGAFPER